MSEEDSNDSFREELSFTKEEFPVNKDFNRLVDVFDTVELEEIQVTVSVSTSEAALYKDLFDSLFDSESEEQDQQSEEQNQESSSEPEVLNMEEISRKEELNDPRDREVVENDSVRFGKPEPDEVQMYSGEPDKINRNTQPHYILALLAAETDPDDDVWFTGRQLENLEYSPFSTGQTSSVLSRIFHEKKCLQRTGVESPTKHEARVKYRPTEADRELVAELGRFDWPNEVERPDVVPPRAERPFVF